MIWKKAPKLLMNILVVVSLMMTGRPLRAEDTSPDLSPADCEAGLNLCDQALDKCDTLSKEQIRLIGHLKALAASKDAQITELEGRDKIIYRQPLPWLLLGAAVSLLNPAIGIPLIAVGVAREL